MDINRREELTNALCELAAGRWSAEELIEVAYEDFRRMAHALMQNESPGHTLDATAVVNEAYLKLIDQSRVIWNGKTHFIAVGANIMRRILVDHAKSKRRLKRGGESQRVSLDFNEPLSPERDEDLLALDEALQRLTEKDPRQAQIVEMRFFGGLKVDEVADLLGVSKRTVENDWRMVRAWLKRELSQDDQR